MPTSHLSYTSPVASFADLEIHEFDSWSNDWDALTLASKICWAPESAEQFAQ